MEAAEIVKPNLIVPPDYLGDGEKTLKELISFVNTYSARVLPVIQGQNLEECRLYGKKIFEYFSRVAVPYDITCSRDTEVNMMAISRNGITSLLKDIGFREIHLLGFTNLEELEGLKLVGWPGIRLSIDTGVPVLMGLEGKKLGRDKLKDKRVPTLDRMPGVDTLYMQLSDVYYNIGILRRTTNGS
jgi:hypothetical protein